LELLSADGLATPSQEAELRAAGMDPAAGQALRIALKAALSPGGPEVELAGAVVRETGLADPSLALKAALAVDVQIDVVDAVLGELGLEDGWSAIHAGLQIDDAEIPDLVDAVMVEAVGGVPDLGGLLRDAAGPAPDLADAIMAELAIGAPAAVDSPTPDSPTPDNVVRLRPRWAQVGMVMAAAAALLLVVSGGPEGGGVDQDDVAWELSPVNELDIEEMESDAMVQIFQFDEGAPTIIWVDEMDDIDLFGDEEGVAL